LGLGIQAQLTPHNPIIISNEKVTQKTVFIPCNQAQNLRERASKNNFSKSEKDLIELLKLDTLLFRGRRV
jgi:hypothetical protein